MIPGAVAGSRRRSGGAAPSARYWRINVTKTWQDPNPYLSIAEIEMRATHGGADQTTGKTFTADNSHTSGPIANINDDNAANIWTTITALPHWAVCDFGSAVTVTEVAITARSDGFRYEPKDFTIDYSTDNVSWTTAFTQTNAPGWAGGDTKVFSW